MPTYKKKLSRGERHFYKFDIKKNKLDKLEKFGDIPGLPKHTKILIVYSYHLYNVYRRPIEYPQIEDELKALRNRFSTLVEYSKPYNKHLFRLMPFCDFHILNQAVWYNTAGEKVQLI